MPMLRRSPKKKGVFGELGLHRLGDQLAGNGGNEAVLPEVGIVEPVRLPAEGFDQGKAYGQVFNGVDPKHLGGMVDRRYLSPKTELR
jgi:hypothetical protein